MYLRLPPCWPLNLALLQRLLLLASGCQLQCIVCLDTIVTVAVYNNNYSTSSRILTSHFMKSALVTPCPSEGPSSPKRQHRAPRNAAAKALWPTTNASAILWACAWGAGNVHGTAHRFHVGRTDSRCSSMCRSKCGTTAPSRTTAPAGKAP